MENQPSTTPVQAPAPATIAPYPARIEFELPTSQSRILALFSIVAVRMLLLIPHIIVLYIVQIAAALVAWLNMWVVLFTGHGSAGMQKFVSGSLRWSTRMSSYMYGLNDKYPPFSLN